MTHSGSILGTPFERSWAELRNGLGDSQQVPLKQGPQLGALQTAIWAVQLFGSCSDGLYGAPFEDPF